MKYTKIGPPGTGPRLAWVFSCFWGERNQWRRDQRRNHHQHVSLLPVSFPRRFRLIVSKNGVCTTKTTTNTKNRKTRTYTYLWKRDRWHERGRIVKDVKTRRREVTAFRGMNTKICERYNSNFVRERPRTKSSSIRTFASSDYSKAFPFNLEQERCL